MLGYHFLTYLTCLLSDCSSVVCSTEKESLILLLFQVLSQFDLPDVCTKVHHDPLPVSEISFQKQNIETGVGSNNLYNAEPCPMTAVNKASSTPHKCVQTTDKLSPDVITGTVVTTAKFVSPKHTKRKIIDSLFDTKSKRKFPGPAGLLSGTLEESKDDSIGHMEFLSQV